MKFKYRAAFLGVLLAENTIPAIFGMAFFIVTTPFTVFVPEYWEGMIDRFTTAGAGTILIALLFFLTNIGFQLLKICANRLPQIRINFLSWGRWSNRLLRVIAKS